MPSLGVLNRLRVVEPIAAARTYAHPVGEHVQIHLPVIACESPERAMAEVEHLVEQRRRTGAIRSVALAVCDRAVRGIGRVLKGCYALAGFPELARKVRFDVKAKDIQAKGGV